MASFVIANLGDGIFTLPSSTVTTGGLLTLSGLIFVNNGTGGDITITLDDDLSPYVTIKDIAGNAGADNIIISYAGGIDSGTTYTLAVDWSWVTLAWTGSSYAVIG